MIKNKSNINIDNNNRVQIKLRSGYVIKLEQINEGIQNVSFKRNIHYLKSYFQRNSDQKNDQRKKKQMSKAVDQLTFNLGTIFEEYKYKSKNQFFCSQFCKMSKNPMYSFYKCLDCELQKNSILCKNCFDFSKHKTHDYKLINLQGGSCDCGDQSKWKQQTFCDNHKPIPFNNDDNQLSTSQQIQLKLIIGYLLRTLILLYQQFKKHYVQQAQLLYQLDQFGYILCKQLTQLNVNRRLINKITLQVLQEAISFRDVVKLGKMVQLQLKYILLRLIYLDKTAGQICALYLKLFYQNDKFKKDVTVSYIQNYSRIRSYNITKYHDFAPQLFNNSYIIKELCQKKSMPLFILYFQNKSILKLVEGKSISQKKQVFDRLNEQMDIYLADLQYFTMLIPRCAEVYWNYFAEKNGFIKLGQCLQIFKEDQYFDIYKGQTYFEQSILTHFIDILNISDFDFMKRVLSQLYDKITTMTQSNNYNQRTNKTDYYMLYQRMWALTSYIFLVSKPKKFINIFTEINDQKYSKQVFRLLYQHNKMKNPQSAAQIINLIFDKVLTYFKKIVFLEYNQIYQKQHLTQNRYVFMLYFCSQNLLFSIDSILLKLCLKFMYYLSDLSKQINIKSTLGLKINNMFSHDQKKLQNHNMSRVVKQYLFFLGLFNEAFYSDLPDIILSTKFVVLRQKQQYRKAYLHYLNNIYNSLKNQPNSEEQITKMYDFSRKALFYEQTVLQYCSEVIKLQRKQKYEINFNYFYHIKYKITNLFKNLHNDKISFYFQNPHQNFILQTNLIDYVQSFIDKTTSFLLKQSQQNNHIALGNRYRPNKNDSFNKQKQQLFKLMLTQMHKLLTLTKSQQLLQYYKDYHEKYRQQLESIQFIKESLSSFNKQQQSLSIYQSQSQYKVDLNSQQASEQSASISVESSTISQFVKSAQYNLDTMGKKEICVICNKVNHSHELSLLCSIEISRFYNNFGIDQDFNYIYFQTCYHCVHDVCRQKLKQSYCPKCLNRFDFIFRNYTANDYKEAQLAYQDFSNELTQAVLKKFQSKSNNNSESLSSSELKQSQKQKNKKQKLKSFIYLFQSIILLILKSLLIIQKQTFINFNINIYKNIYLYLIRYCLTFEDTHKLNEVINQSLFNNVKLDICHQIVRSCIDNLGQLLFSQFKFQKNYHHGETRQNPYVNYHLNQNQESFINEVLEVFKKSKVSPFYKHNPSNNSNNIFAKMGKIHDMYSFKIKQFALSNPFVSLTIQLPKTLAGLQERYKGDEINGSCSSLKCVNHTKPNKCLFVQYIRQKQNQQKILKCCINCLKQTVFTYSQQKKSQIYMIRSDNGRIYFFKVSGLKLKSLIISSLYYNNLGQIFQQTENISKSLFSLDRQIQRKLNEKILSCSSFQGYRPNFNHNEDYRQIIQ